MSCPIAASSLCHAYVAALKFCGSTRVSPSRCGNLNLCGYYKNISGSILFCFSSTSTLLRWEGLYTHTVSFLTSIEGPCAYCMILSSGKELC